MVDLYQLFLESFPSGSRIRRSFYGNISSFYSGAYFLIPVNNDVQTRWEN